MKIQLLMPDALFEEFMQWFHVFTQQHTDAPFEMFCGSEEDGQGGLSADDALRILQKLGGDMLVEKLTKQ